MRSILLFLSLALLVAGCGTTAQTSVRSDAPGPSREVGGAGGATPAASGTLRWGIAGLADLPTLDPALASDTSSMSVASLVYGGLVRLDGQAHVVPDGARTWTISRHGTVYTFSLRHDLRFADGRRVTASDFASALARALGPEGSAGTAPLYLGLIAPGATTARGGNGTARAITVLNPTTLRITLSHPAAHFLAELAFPASYVPDARLLARYGPSWTDHAAGFGPYVVRSWRHSRYLILERNPYYYGGKPSIKRISMQFYEQPSAAVAAYQHGGLDLVSGLQPGASVPAHVTGVRRVPGLALDYLAFNTTRLPFRRIYARRAFAAIWSPRIATQTVGHAAFAPGGFLPSAFGMTTTGVRPTGSASGYLARARYPGGNNFPTITLAVLRDPQVYAVARKLQSAWAKVLGVVVNLRQLNPSTYDQVLNTRDFDLAIVRWGADYPDPQDFLGTQLGPVPGNVTGWSGREYNRAVALADSYAPTDPRRIALFRRAAWVAARKVPLVPLDEPALVGLLSPSLVGVHLTPLGTIEGDWTSAGFR